MAKRSSSIRVPDAGIRRAAPPVKPVAHTPLRLDRLIHERLRLGIVSALAVNERLTFYELKKLLQTTDGNLSVHARKLEEAEYITCHKSNDGGVRERNFASRPPAVARSMACRPHGGDPRGVKPDVVDDRTRTAAVHRSHRDGARLGTARPAPLSRLPDRRAVPHPIELGRRADRVFYPVHADSRKVGPGRAAR